MSEKLVRKLWNILSFCDPETLHNISLKLLDMGLLLPLFENEDDPALSTRALGQHFPNPIGIAAGFDKNAKIIRPLIRLGFGFVEVGTVTLRPQEGNPRPRLFRLDGDHAIINRMGLNSRGIHNLVSNLKKYRKHVGKKRITHPVGINLGLNRQSKEPLDDYIKLFGGTCNLANYLTFNFSCPNVKQSSFEDTMDFLKHVLNRVEQYYPQHPPILLKISPDLSEEQLASLVQFAEGSVISGLVITNTTIQRPHTLKSPDKMQKGGLSGRPLADMSLRTLRFVARRSGGELTLISCGGIETGRDVLERIKNGANLVQIYTSFIFRGPYCLHHIKREMLNEMRLHNIETLDDIRGSVL